MSEDGPRTHQTILDKKSVDKTPDEGDLKGIVPDSDERGTEIPDKDYDEEGNPSELNFED